MSDDAKPGAVVVGTGFGCRVHVPALRAAGFDVVALVGADHDRTARRAARCGVPLALTDLDAALALDGADVVTIATPPYMHASMTIAAAEAGKHIICEKPFALDAVEARSMLAAAKAAGVVHLVGHEFRWVPDRAVAARAIANGAIGEPRFASFVTYVPLVAGPETKMPSWWFSDEKGGGWLGASGSHVVDQIRTWLGEFESVSATLGAVSARRGVAADSFTLRFRMRSGVDGVMQQSGGAWGPVAGMTRVAGTEGTLWTEGERVWIADQLGVRALDVPAELMSSHGSEQSDDPRHRFTHLELGPYTRLCEVLRSAVDGSAPRAAVAIPTFADGVACMEVLDAIRRSAAADGAVAFVEPRDPRL